MRKKFSLKKEKKRKKKKHEVKLRERWDVNFSQQPCLITAQLFVNDSINRLFDWPATSPVSLTRQQRNELNG